MKYLFWDTYFKNETGENFSTYLTRVRMEKAKQFLRDRRFRIYEDSEKFGYRNSKSFARAFAEYYGVSLSQFRNGR